MKSFLPVNHTLGRSLACASFLTCGAHSVHRQLHVQPEQRIYPSPFDLPPETAKKFTVKQPTLLTIGSVVTLLTKEKPHTEI